MNIKTLNPENNQHRAYAWKILNALVCDVTGADLTNADLTNADLRASDLRASNLYGADFTDADLRDADLRGADLRGADLRGANLRGANLRDANLRDANLRGAKNILRISGQNGSSEGRDLIANMREKDGEFYCHIYAGCWGADGHNGAGGTLNEFRNRVNDVYGEGHEYHDDIARLAMWEARRQADINGREVTIST